MAKRGQDVQKEGIWEFSTSALSPTTNDLPSEPLLQFMSPRKVGSKVIYDPYSPEGYPGKSIGREQEFENTEAVTTTISSSALAEPRDATKETAEPKWPTEAAAAIARVTDTVEAETTNCSDPRRVPQHGEGISGDLDITAILQNKTDKYSSCSSIMDEKKPDQGASNLLDHDLQPRDGQTLAAGHKERSKEDKEECVETLPLKPSNATLSATAVTSSEPVASSLPCVNHNRSMPSISSPSSVTQKSASSNGVSTSALEAPIARSTSRPTFGNDVSPEQVSPPHQPTNTDSLLAEDIVVVETPSAVLPLIASTTILESSLPPTQDGEAEEVLASASLPGLATSGESPAAATVTNGDRDGISDHQFVDGAEVPGGTSEQLLPVPAAASEESPAATNRYGDGDGDGD